MLRRGNGLELLDALTAGPWTAAEQSGAFPDTLGAEVQKLVSVGALRAERAAVLLRAPVLLGRLMAVRPRLALVMIECLGSLPDGMCALALRVSQGNRAKVLAAERGVVFAGAASLSAALAREDLTVTFTNALHARRAELCALPFVGPMPEAAFMTAQSVRHAQAIAEFFPGSVFMQIAAQGMVSECTS
ncbi:hypothetical protein [Deinococcus kurensis]|uniref:hypothetical protein n=1 Tax=Deinococcus kurensis TaxID=2662757 RepID=UPI0012D31868|nr:hypothetical protein [Deinococcus kurensis]